MLNTMRWPAQRSAGCVDNWQSPFSPFPPALVGSMRCSLGAHGTTSHSPPPPQFCPAEEQKCEGYYHHPAILIKCSSPQFPTQHHTYKMKRKAETQSNGHHGKGILKKRSKTGNHLNCKSTTEHNSDLVGSSIRRRCPEMFPEGPLQ